MVFSYQSKRNGRTYYLRRTIAQNKILLYYFNLTPKDGIEELPVGYEVSENVHGYPLLRKKRPELK